MGSLLELLANAIVNFPEYAPRWARWLLGALFVLAVIGAVYLFAASSD